jgi:putative hydrolase of the HAD superfamily
MTPQQFIQIAINQFAQEFIYYTHPDVQTTAHQVGTPFKESWTQLLCDLKVIERSESIERYTELERTLSALYCFTLTTQDNTYATFTAAQNNNEKLSVESYADLCKQVKNRLKDNKDFSDVLTCLIIYSDLGKSPRVRALAQVAGIDASLDTDDLVLAILNLAESEVAKIIPSFANLTPTAKNLLRTAYPLMTACLGHLYFLEGGPKTLHTIAQALQSIMPDQREPLLALVFLAQLFDAVGSQGQLNMAGSVTCTKHFYRAYTLVNETLFALEREMRVVNDIHAAVTISFDHYLQQRAKWLGLEKHTFRKPADFEFIVRLACTLRFFDAQQAKLLQEIFYQLDPAYQTLLTEQLSFNPQQGINLFARTPHYVATSAQNISRVAISNNDMLSGIRLALNAEICLSLLIQEINKTYPHVATKTKLPISFGKIAFRAVEPGFMDPKTFDPSLAVWTLPRPKPTTVIKNLIFDLGHVFIKIDKSRYSIYKAFSELAKKHAIKLSVAEIGERINNSEIEKIILDFHCGTITTPDFRRAMLNKLNLSTISDEEFDQAFCASILATPAEVEARLAYVKTLVDQGYNIYVLSNNNEIHRLHNKAHYAAMHWGRYFFKQYYSNETGKAKPELQAFMQILKENQLKANETLFFDDVFSYVEAAWNYGIPARQFSVNHPMQDVDLSIATMDKRINALPQEKRLSTLFFFCANKFKSILENKKLNQKRDQIDDSILKMKP